MMKLGSTEVSRGVRQLQGAAKAQGLRLTHQRLEICREVASSEEHPDAEEVFRALRERTPTLSIDTVYRTLWKVEEMGLIATLVRRRGRVRFDANLTDHHHYVCVRCGTVRDVGTADLGLPPMPQELEPLGTVVTAHVELRGVCTKCAPSRPDGAASRAGPRPHCG